MIACSRALRLKSTKHTGECLRVGVRRTQIQGEPELKFTVSISYWALKHGLFMQVHRYTCTTFSYSEVRFHLGALLSRVGDVALN